VEAVNAPADFMAGRMLVAKQARVPPAVLRDQAQPMRDLAI
jgi:3-phenylpropionate/trans-cinnamate dioxygenase ferredoxin reductase component